MHEIQILAAVRDAEYPAVSKGSNKMLIGSSYVGYEVHVGRLLTFWRMLVYLAMLARLWFYRVTAWWLACLFRTIQQSHPNDTIGSS